MRKAGTDGVALAPHSQRFAERLHLNHSACKRLL